jgi:limonene 1,2-monooxygenase
MRGETVTHKSDWFELRDARLQMTPYSRPSVEFAVASQVSPTGARAAGPARPRPALDRRHQRGRVQRARLQLAHRHRHGRRPRQDHGPQRWRLVGPMHIAPTREQAMEEVKFGLEKWIYYFREIANLPIVPEGDDPIKAMVESGLAVIGTPDDAAARIQQLVDESGGFGAFL